MPEPSPQEPARAPVPLYLVAPAETAVDAVETALAAAQVACMLITNVNPAAPRTVARIAHLRPPALAQGVAVLLEDRVELVVETGCDGVHLSNAGAYRAARGLLGRDAIVGVGCGDSRHDAMVAAEADADYVAFGRHEPARPAAPELLAWWQEIMVVPCVAFGAVGPDDCARLAAAGADFVAPGAALWADPAGPGQPLRACATAIARAMTER